MCLFVFTSEFSQTLRSWLCYPPFYRWGVRGAPALRDLQLPAPLSRLSCMLHSYSSSTWHFKPQTISHSSGQEAALACRDLPTCFWLQPSCPAPTFLLPESGNGGGESLASGGLPRTLLIAVGSYTCIAPPSLSVLQGRGCKQKSQSS